MFKFSLQVIRTIIAVIFGVIFCFGLYLSFDYFSSTEAARGNRLSIITHSLDKLPLSINSQVLGSWSTKYPEAASFINKIVSFLSVGEIFSDLNSEKSLEDSVKPILRIAILADSHQDNISLEFALKEARAEGVDFVIHLGDFSRVGEKKDLFEAKKVLDESSLLYYLTAGDHDRWVNNGFGYFEEVLGSPYQLVNVSDTCLLIVDNSNLYYGLKQEQKEWLDSLDLDDCSNGKFFFSHIPLYHPSSTRAMGEKSKEVKKDADWLLSWSQKNGFLAFFAGDLHLADFYVYESLPIYILGALDRGGTLGNPGWGVLEVYNTHSWRFSPRVLSI